VVLIPCSYLADTVKLRSVQVRQTAAMKVTKPLNRGQRQLKLSGNDN